MDLQVLASQVTALQRRIDDLVSAQQPNTVLVKGTNQAISSTTFATITGLSQSVTIARTKFRFSLIYNSGGSVGDPRFQLTGPAMGLGRYMFTAWGQLNTQIVRQDQTSGFGVSMAAQTNVNGFYFLVDIEGIADFQAAGTLAVQAKLQAGGDSTYTVNDSSWSECRLI